MILLKLLLAAGLLGLILWLRAGRPGVERLPARLRPAARALPILAAPLVLLLLLWGWVGPRAPRGIGR